MSSVVEIYWAYQSPYPILAALQLLPLVGVLAVVFARLPAVAIAIGLLVSVAELLLAVDLYYQYQVGESAMQFSEYLPFLGPLEYHAAADGLTVLFVLLTAVLTVMLVLYSLARKIKPEAHVVALIFVTEAIVMSLLVTLDLLWFCLLTAVQLVPVAFLILRWSSSPMKSLALTRFLQFMAASVLLLLLASGMLGYNHFVETGRWSFDLLELKHTPLPASRASIVFLLLFFGFAIRTPLFPVHGWLPLLMQHGSVAIAPVFLLGIKVGVYGMLRFMFPLVPEAVVEWHWFVVAIATVGIFYAALLALMQTGLRRVLSFAVVSHTSILMLALFSLGHDSMQGGVMLAINFGLAISILMFMTGLVYRRTHSTLLKNLGGLFDRIPMIGAAFLIAGLAIVGMPGTPGFDAIHLMLEDAIHRFGALLTIAAALGNVAAAGFLLWAFQCAFLATRADGQASQVETSTRLETFFALLVIATLLGAGFYTEPWLALIDEPLHQLSETFAQFEKVPAVTK